MFSPALERIARYLGWAAISAAVVVSLVPAGVRPHSGFRSELEHFAAYVCVSALLAFGYHRRVSPSVVTVLLGFAAIGLEIAQSVIPNRHAGVEDALAGIGGAAAGALLVRCLLFLAGPVEHPPKQ